MRGENMARNKYEAMVERFIAEVNNVVIPRIRWDELNASYSEPDHLYAKQVLGEIHQAFERVYGQAVVSEETCGEFVCLPAITRANNTGEMCVALVQIDLTSSGEHWDTQFFTEQGILPHPDCIDRQKDGRIDRLIPYSYWYTPPVHGDIHVDFRHVPSEVADVLQVARSLPVVEREPKHRKPKSPER